MVSLLNGFQPCVFLMHGPWALSGPVRASDAVKNVRRRRVLLKMRKCSVPGVAPVRWAEPSANASAAHRWVAAQQFYLVRTWLAVSRGCAHLSKRPPSCTDASTSIVLNGRGDCRTRDYHPRRCICFWPCGVDGLGWLHGDNTVVSDAVLTC